MTQTLDPVLVQWGLNIRQAREAKGMRRGEFARHIEVSEVTTWRWESGIREPSRHHKALIAELLATPAGVLFPFDTDGENAA